MSIGKADNLAFVGSVDTRDAAESVGLVYVSDEQPGISRLRKGDHFLYCLARGKPVNDDKVLQRIRSLAVPPAYSDVWICPNQHGHIQATGRDAKGRKQYRYHAKFREVREGTKYEHMQFFTLPDRRRIKNFGTLGRRPLRHLLRSGRGTARSR